MKTNEIAPALEKRIELAEKDRLLRVADVQEICNVSRTKVYDMLSKGLRHLKIGGTLRIRESVLERYLEECEVG